MRKGPLPEWAETCPLTGPCARADPLARDETEGGAPGAQGRAGGKARVGGRCSRRPTRARSWAGAKANDQDLPMNRNLVKRQPKQYGYDRNRGHRTPHTERYGISPNGWCYAYFCLISVSYLLQRHLKIISRRPQNWKQQWNLTSTQSFRNCHEKSWSDFLGACRQRVLP